MLRFSVLIPLVAATIKWQGVQFTVDLFCNPKKFKRVESVDNVDNAREILKALKQTVRSVRLNGNCLSRSIALQRLLQNNGISSEIKIGVLKLNRAFKAHAWVEHNGIPLNAGSRVRNKYRVVTGYNIAKDLTFS